jgi:glutamine amidotransferase
MNPNSLGRSVGILSLGIGNIAAVHASLRRICVKSINVSSPHDLRKISHLIIPGVGAMGEFMARVNAFGLANEIRAFAGYGKVLGICLGFQSLYSYSDEGSCECLALLDGEVKSLRQYASVKTNVGYLPLVKNEDSFTSSDIVPGSPLQSQCVANVKLNNEYYFTHSYFAPVAKQSIYLAQLTPSLTITAVASNGENVFGTQFHPELSHAIGRTLIARFLSI